MSVDLETPVKAGDGSKKRKRKEKHGKDGHKKRKHEQPADGTPETPKTPHSVPITTSQVASEQDSHSVQVTDTNTDFRNSPFFVQSTSFYLPLSPIAQSAPLQGLCAEHFSPLLLTFAAPFNGIVLSYANPRFNDPTSEQLHDAQKLHKKKLKHEHEDTLYSLNNSSDHENPDGMPQSEDEAPTVVLSRSIDEYGVTYTWVAADFLILRPQRDSWLEGHVNVQSPSQLGLVCWNLVNVSIERKNLPKDWKWVGGSDEQRGKSSRKSHNKPHAVDGHFVDANGARVEGNIRFRVLEIESLQAFGKDRNFLSVEGSLLPAAKPAQNK